MRYTDRSWWSVEDAAKLLRVNVHTLYRACQRGDFPHNRWSYGIRIPCEALLLIPRPQTLSRNYHLLDAEQMAFDFDVPIIPVRRYRNTRELVRLGDYERSLSHNRTWRNQLPEE